MVRHPTIRLKGHSAGTKHFGRVFGNFQSCKVDIVETDVVVNGDMAEIKLKSGK